MYGSHTNQPRPRFVPVQPHMYDREAEKEHRRRQQEESRRLPRQYRGNHFADPDKVDVRSLVYNTKNLKHPDGSPRNTRGSHTWVRILPTRDMAAPEAWAPQTQDGAANGQWLFPVEMWKGGLKKRISLIPWWPWDKPEDEWSNPAHRLRWQIWRTQKDNQGEWWFKHLVTKDHGPLPEEFYGQGVPRDRYIPLPGMSWNYLVRAIVYRWGEDVPDPIQGLGTDDKVTLLDLGPAAGKAIFAEVGQNGGDFALDKGLFHVFYGHGDDPTVDEKFRDLSVVGYGARRVPEVWRGGPTPDLSAYGPVLGPKLAPWNEVLTVHSAEDQARILAEAFPPELLRAGWQGQRDLLKVVDDVYGTAAHVPMSPPHQPPAPGGYPAPGGGYQAPPAPGGYPAAGGYPPPPAAGGYAGQPPAGHLAHQPPPPAPGGYPAPPPGGGYQAPAPPAPGGYPAPPPQGGHPQGGYPATPPNGGHPGHQPPPPAPGGYAGHQPSPPPPPAPGGYPAPPAGGGYPPQAAPAPQAPPPPPPPPQAGPSAPATAPAGPTPPFQPGAQAGQATPPPVKGIDAVRMAREQLAQRRAAGSAG